MIQHHEVPRRFAFRMNVAGQPRDLCRLAYHHGAPLPGRHHGNVECGAAKIARRYECVKAAVERALEGFTASRPEVWLYRGAWQEWPITEADVLVPLSQEELRAKVMAIFKHQSQKDTAPFPGPYDDREFWQRVEARNLETAAHANRLGLPEYYAMEAYRVVGSPAESR